jgi:predicted ribosomally synthesized peptide with nif11-like leader
MSENLDRFMDLVRGDVDLQTRLSQLKPEDFATRVVQIAGDLGVPLTSEDLASSLHAARPEKGELNDSALESVAGGSSLMDLQLQMTLDNYSKFMSTLSNVLKQQSSTTDAIIQNLK